MLVSSSTTLVWHPLSLLPLAKLLALACMRTGANWTYAGGSLHLHN